MFYGGYQPRATGGQLILNINQILSTKNASKLYIFFEKVQSKMCQKCLPFLESKYPEMQRKHISVVSEYLCPPASTRLMTDSTVR